MNATNEPNLNTNPAEVRAAIKTLFPAGSLVELRIPKSKSGTIVGYFDDEDLLVDAICKYSGDVPAVYYTLNRPAPEMACSLNTAASGRPSTSDNQIARRNWLLIDCDPIRLDADGTPLVKQTVSSTESEKAEALETMKAVHVYLQEKGWAAPISADSGNGYHLLYHLDLPNTDEVNNAIEDTLTHLSQKFSTDTVYIDTTVSNASRITKAYGSIAKKGIATVDRPHRKSSLRSQSLANGGKACVTLDQLKSLASLISVPVSKTKSGIVIKVKGHVMVGTGEGNTPAKMEEFFDFYHLDFKPKERTKKGDGWQWIMIPCPFNPEHNNGEASAFINDDGSLGFKCFHNSCKDHHWVDLRDHLEKTTGDKFFFGKSNLKIAAPTAPGTMVWKKGSEFKPELLEWLWEGRLPRRSSVAFAGDMGVGKSIMSLDIIARGSVGADWVDGQKNTYGKFSSVLLAAEDDVNTIIIPRLIAAGGDPNMVYFPDVVKVGEGENEADREIRLSTDLQHIKDLLKTDKTIKLVVIDPLSNYVGDKNTFVEQEIRQITMPLARMAQEFDIVIILIFHHNKSRGSSAMQKVIGAAGNIGACRLGWTFLKDPQDEDQKLMLQMKENLGKFDGIMYSTEPVQVMVNTPEGGQVKQPHARIKYLGKNESSASIVIAASEDPENKIVVKSTSLLAKICPKGMAPTLVTEIYAQLEEAGETIPDPTAFNYKSVLKSFERTRKKLGIVATNNHGIWYWSRPACCEGEFMYITDKPTVDATAPETQGGL